MYVCSVVDCPTLIPRAGRCPEHACQVDRARGTRQKRGYDRDYDTVRQQWARRVARETVNCWRCGKPINPAEPWHLGHDDDDRNIIRGPEHAHCNLSAAGRAAHRR